MIKKQVVLHLNLDAVNLTSFCDMREYYRNFYNESSYIVTKTYQSNMKHGYISKSMAITKIDEVNI